MVVVVGGLTESLVEHQQDVRIVHHLLPEACLGHQHLPVVSDPGDGHHLELLQTHLVCSDQNINCILKIDLVPEHLETLLQEGWKLEPPGSLDHFDNLLWGNVDLVENYEIAIEKQQKGMQGIT